MIVSDASMSPYEITMPGGSVEHWNEEPGHVWMKRLLGHFRKAVWFNPVPKPQWGYTQSIALLRQLLADRMYPLNAGGDRPGDAGTCSLGHTASARGFIDRRGQPAGASTGTHRDFSRSAKRVYAGSASLCRSCTSGTFALMPITYEHSPRPVGGPIQFSLEGETLTVDSGRKVSEVRLGAVDLVRMTFEPGGLPRKPIAPKW